MIGMVGEFPAGDVKSPLKIEFIQNGQGKIRVGDGWVYVNLLKAKLFNKWKKVLKRRERARHRRGPYGGWVW